MKTLVRYTKYGAVYVQNGEYTIQSPDLKSEKKCCKHGTAYKEEEGAWLRIADNVTGTVGVYCMSCLIDFLDREIGRIN